MQGIVPSRAAGGRLAWLGQPQTAHGQDMVDQPQVLLARQWQSTHWITVLILLLFLSRGFGGSIRRAAVRAEHMSFKLLIEALTPVTSMSRA
eukprot:1318508-Rhodomonas_salina.1